MSTQLHGTKEQLEDLAEEFGANYPLGKQIEYDDHLETYYMIVDGEEGQERVDIEDKYYPIIGRFII